MKTYQKIEILQYLTNVISLPKEDFVDYYKGISNVLLLNESHTIIKKNKKLFKRLLVPYNNKDIVDYIGYSLHSSSLKGFLEKIPNSIHSEEDLKILYKLIKEEPKILLSHLKELFNHHPYVFDSGIYGFFRDEKQY